MGHFTRGEFAALALPYLQEVTAFARRLSRNEWDADDLVQATYEQAFRKWRELRDGARCRSWLFRIARNLHIDRARASSARSEIHLIESNHRPIPEPIVSAETVERLTARDLDAALGRLPEEQRQAVLLCDLWGFRYDEIAEITDSPIGTVRSRMTCPTRSETISAYLDGETTGEERHFLERHVATCTACADRLASFRALKHAVARLEGRGSPPEAIQARIDALRFHQPSGWRRLEQHGVGIGVAALLLVTLAAALVWRPRGRDRPLLEELIADHLRSAPDVLPAEVASADRVEVRRFFQSKVPFGPVVPTLGSARLLGGRLCKLQGRNVQLLFYELAGRKLSLYVSDRPASAETCHKDGEHCVCGQRRGNLSLMLVGRATEQELRELLSGAVL
jgi:RNA polymerase sigma-70 factor (ECF subfamily)